MHRRTRTLVVALVCCLATASGGVTALAGPSVGLPPVPAGSGPRVAPPAPSRPAAGDVGVSVSVVTFAVADGLPATLRRGHRYRTVVRLVVSPGYSGATATVASQNARVIGCSGLALGPGQVQTLRCDLTPDAGAKVGSALRLTVTVVVPGAPDQVRTFAHRVC